MITLLIDFSPIKPDFGLILWTTVIFCLFWWIMKRYAFGPIAAALITRESDIQTALDEAKKAREEMSGLKAENEQLLQKARQERAQMLKEAKDTKNNIISEAKTRAREEANRVIVEARKEIETQKKAALAEIKSEVGLIALDIAEKIIRKELKGIEDQERFVDKMVKEINDN